MSLLVSGVWLPSPPRFLAQERAFQEPQGGRTFSSFEADKCLRTFPEKVPWENTFTLSDKGPCSSSARLQHLFLPPSFSPPPFLFSSPLPLSLPPPSLSSFFPSFLLFIHLINIYFRLLCPLCTKSLPLPLSLPSVCPETGR